VRSAVKCLEMGQQQKHTLFPFAATMTTHTHLCSHPHTLRTHTHTLNAMDTVGMACLNMQFQFPKNTKRVQHAEDSQLRISLNGNGNVMAAMG